VVKAKSGDKHAAVEEKLCRNIMQVLKNGQFVKTVSMNEEEKQMIKNYNLLTMKPILYVANISEHDAGNAEQNIHYQKLQEFVSKNTQDQLIAISANIEYEISRLPNQDKQIFMQDLNMKQSGLDRLIYTTYKLLNLSTYFTFGIQEVKA
jgi:ribosome-binding ATPase YchF (GTP1/OBG family)